MPAPRSDQTNITYKPHIAHGSLKQVSWLLELAAFEQQQHLFCTGPLMDQIEFVKKPLEFLFYLWQFKLYQNTAIKLAFLLFDALNVLIIRLKP